MQILVVGSGAREHCLADKLSQSPLVDRIYCAPGNGGTSGLGKNIAIEAEDIEALLQFALEKKIGLTVVGPEAPLAKGIVDRFKQEGLAIFGPDKELARLESSKIFAKEMMQKFNIPTADFKVFGCPDLAKKYIETCKIPVVVKADGLAAGKGVVVCQSRQEAKEAVEMMMLEGRFGESGRRILIEDCLKGQELSLMVFTDGKTILPLVDSQDHKSIFDNGQGPNTGGMGAYSPTPLLNGQKMDRITEIVFRPLIDGLSRENKVYKGMLYAGLMIQDDKIYVLEFNVRLGDPEAQAILPKLKSDLLEVMLKTIDSKLSEVTLDWDSRSCVCVVLASAGYPGSYQKGKKIKGLDELEKREDALIYHSGTKRIEGQGKQFDLVTNGGRVLSVVGLGHNIQAAKDKAYWLAKKIEFEGIQYRKDIGDKALRVS